MDDPIQFEIDLEQDPEIVRQVDEALSKMDDEFQKRDDRVGQMDLIHEDLVVVDKIDARSMMTFLHLAQKDKEAAVRTSYYGRIIAISKTDSGDDIKEMKKRQLAPGDVISFNPDSGYSLNIIVPEDMPTIWVLSIDNVLVRDRGFNLVTSRKKTVIADIVIARVRQHQATIAMEAAHRKLEADKKIKG